MGFYYANENERPQGFYYDQIDGFYYNNQDGFYYDTDGFYYDREDALSKKNLNFWNEGEGKPLFEQALVGLRTEIDAWVANNQHQLKAKKDFIPVALEVVSDRALAEAIDEFKQKCNPNEFLKIGGDLAGRIRQILEKEVKERMSPGNRRK